MTVLDDIARRNAERRESFAKMLENGDDVETIRAAAIKYLDGKIEETMETIDFAWGDQLQAACIMQERYQAKKAEIEKADDAKQIVALVG